MMNKDFSVEHLAVSVLAELSENAFIIAEWRAENYG